MSKAFTREDAGDVAAPVPRRELDLPPGSPSYLTPAGARRLRDELDLLVRTARPDAVRAAAAAPAGDVEAARRALQTIDQRIAELTDHLAVAEIVEPSTQERDRVRFGATVTLARDDGPPVAYRIVGIPEADPAHHVVSWRSPVARALLGAAVGDLVTVRTPRGNEELEVTSIAYEA